MLYASPDAGDGTALFATSCGGDGGGDGVLYLTSVVFANLRRRGVALCFGFTGFRAAFLLPTGLAGSCCLRGFCFAGVRGGVGV